MTDRRLRSRRVHLASAHSARCGPVGEAHAFRHEATLGQTVLPNGGTLTLRGGLGGKVWRRWSADAVIIDEYDGFPGLVGAGKAKGRSWR